MSKVHLSLHCFLDLYHSNKSRRNKLESTETTHSLPSSSRNQFSLPSLLGKIASSFGPLPVSAASSPWLLAAGQFAPPASFPSPVWSFADFYYTPIPPFMLPSHKRAQAFVTMKTFYGTPVFSWIFPFWGFFGVDEPLLFSLTPRPISMARVKKLQ